MLESKDMTTRALLSCREEEVREDSIHGCAVKAPLAHVWLHASFEAHAMCSRCHIERIQKGEQGRKVARREKGKFSGTSVSLPGTA